MTEETALLPCPFCGAPAKIEYYECSDDARVNAEGNEEWPLYFELGCTNKDCPLHGLIYLRQYWPNNPENLKAVRAWNSRFTARPGVHIDLPDFVIYRYLGSSVIYIRRKDGEGGEFPVEDLNEVVAKFYNENAE